MEIPSPVITHTHPYLTERLNDIYVREDAFIPEVFLILTPEVSLAHKKPMLVEWEPPTSCSHMSRRGPLQNRLTFLESPWF